jgi:hypothetical protein
MKTKCKLLAYLLAALMIVGVLPTAALADGDDVDTAAAPVQEVLDTAAQESGSEAAIPEEEPVFLSCTILRPP